MKISPQNSEPATFTINCRGKLIDLSTPKIMGILNLTPDSFSDGGSFCEEKKALVQAEKMIEEGADFIDIGAQSTRPNAERISPEEEILRIGKIISKIKKEFPKTLLSLDTFYSKVLKYGFDEGVDLVNDISGGQFDEQMIETVAFTGLPYVLMHVNKTYESMHSKDTEGDILLTLNAYFSRKIHELNNAGIKDIIIDPGFGFGKTIEQNQQMVEELEFIGMGKNPLLAGISRKSFIYKPLGKNPTEINEETQLLHLKLLKKGAKILRVHDVKETMNVLNNFMNVSEKSHH